MLLMRIRSLVRVNWHVKKVVFFFCIFSRSLGDLFLSDTSLATERNSIKLSRCKEFVGRLKCMYVHESMEVKFCLEKKK